MIAEAAGISASFEIDDYTRWRLMEGLDDIGLTLRHADDITAFEHSRPSSSPSPPNPHPHSRHARAAETRPVTLLTSDVSVR